MVHFRAEGKVNEPKLTLSSSSSSSWAHRPLALPLPHLKSSVVFLFSQSMHPLPSVYFAARGFCFVKINTRKVWALPKERLSVSDRMTRLSCCDPGPPGHYLTRPGDLRASTWCDSHSFIHSTNIYPASVAPLSRSKTNKPLLLCGVDSMGGDGT